MRTFTPCRRKLARAAWATLFAWVALVSAQATEPQKHRSVPTVYYHTFSSAHPPLLRVRPGDTIITQTLDAAGQDFQNVQRAEPSNPLTGPFYVEGAEPGDALVVHIVRLRLNRNWGYSAYRLGLFSLTANAIERLYPNRLKPDLVHKGRADRVPWELDLQSNVVRVREPQSQRLKLEFPAQPMLGCFGVAPPGDQAMSSAISGPNGGNMDYNEVRQGATVYLPVYHRGALLMIGDGHALQADGEPTGTGVETSMDVELTVEVRKNYPLSGPRLENQDYIVSIASQPEFSSDLNRALQVANTDMVEWLTSDYRLEPWAAHLLVGYAGQYQVITVAGSMACKIPRRYLPPR